MLKYLYCKEVFAEIPNEITLGISISGCKIHCTDCNQKELWEDIGTPLTVEELNRLLDEHNGISTLLLLGGEHNVNELTKLFYYAKKRVKTAWYCGLDKLPESQKGILQFLDYIKIGSYKKEKGGLDSPTTNQRLYEIMHLNIKNDITHLLQKRDSDGN